MKKTLLTLAALLSFAAASALSATPVQHLRPAAGGAFAAPVAFEAAESAHKASAFASESGTLTMDYTPAYNPYSATIFNGAYAGLELGLAVELTKDMVDEYAGNKINGIFFYTGVNAKTGYNNITDYTVFLTDDLQGEPFFTKSVKAPATRFTMVTADLDEPCTIQAGKPFYVGIRFKLTDSSDYPIVFDGMLHNDDCGGWYAVYQNGTPSWNNFTDQLGFNCIGAVLEGTTLPADRMSTINFAGTPVAYANEPFSAQVLVVNTGATDITSVEVSTQIGDDPAVTETYPFAQPLTGYNSLAALTLNELSYGKASADPVTVTFTVNKVNGKENMAADKSISYTMLILPEGQGFTRNVVIEEFTGNWCGYCPTGITTMEYIRDHYDDGSFIPCAIHVNGQVRDPMVSPSYVYVSSNFGSGNVPEAIINRSETINPQDLNEVLNAYEAYHALPATAAISCEAAFSETKAKTLELTATTAFTFDNADAAGNYAIAFGITEDGVGPYTQTNYYAGQQGDYGGWESKPRSVSMTYNDVARQLDNLNGIKGSIPASVESGKEYTFSYELTLNSSVKNTDNINVIAYLINLKNGTIENAAYVPAGSIKSGVEDVINDADADAPVEYFNLQGVRVAEPAAGGLYIRRQGKTATKVIL